MTTQACSASPKLVASAPATEVGSSADATSLVDLPYESRLPLDEATHRLPSHIPALDGIRGLAVLLVLFCHATQKQGMDQLLNSGLDRGILTAARISWTGVDLFFVLSGFLITGILFDAKGKDHFFRNFYARRTVRIFPLYYACLVLYLLVFPLFPAINSHFGSIEPLGHTSKLWYWSYLSNYSQSITEQQGRVTDHIIHVSWSLAIEEQFYLCWPLVVFLCTRKTLLKVCAGMFFGSMLLRSILLYFDQYNIAMGFTPCRVDGLATGAFIALVARGPAGLRSLIRPAKIIGPASAVGILLLVASMYKLGYRRGIGQSPGYVICGTTLFALMYGSILVLAAAAAKGTALNRFFAHRFMRMFGKYSYAIYLLHLPVMILVGVYLFHPSQLRVAGTYLPGLAVFWMITFTLSTLAALASWNLLEKHFLKLKDLFPMEAK